MADFTDYLEPMVFTRVKNEIENKCKKKYPNINFTTVSQSDTDAKFPTFYIHLLPFSETGRDMQGSKINGVLATFQIKGSLNTNQTELNSLMANIKSVFKSMRFEVISSPETNKEGDIYVSNMRVRRAIGSTDKL